MRRRALVRAAGGQFEGVDLETGEELQLDVLWTDCFC